MYYYDFPMNEPYNPKNECYDYDDWVNEEFYTEHSKKQTRNIIDKQINAKYVLSMYLVDDYPKMEKWIIENCKGKYLKYANEEWIFEDAQDAMFVKLRWS